MAADPKEMAAKIAALQFWVIDEARPIFPPLYQPRANRIFPDVEPFGLCELISSQQSIKYAFLPFPCCLGLASNKALQASGELVILASRSFSGQTNA